MKKILFSALIAALLISMATCAMAATGLGSVTTVTATPVAEGKDGSISATTTMCFVALDDAGIITDVAFDIVQAKGTFDATGAITCEATAEQQTKRELGDAYGMKKASAIGKEYFEQLDALEQWCIGKTVEEVVTGATDEEKNVDLVAGCTVGISAYLEALTKAAQSAQ